MAIFSMHVSEVQRSKGQSAVAASAYISRSKLSLYKNYSSKNKKNITTYSYINRNDIGYSKIFAPTSAPDWVYDREKLWNRCEEVEKRINSQTARKIMVALPIELTAEQNIELIKEFILKYLIPEGMIVDINIHNDPQNPHAHLQLTMRKLVMDNAGNIDFSKQKFLYWGKKSFITYLRKGVADIINKHLAKHGFTTRVSHLSYADRGIDIIPSKHQGLSRYVKNSSKEKQNKQIVQKNAELIINDPERIIDKLDINKPVYSLKEIKKALQESLYVTLKENTPLKQLENDKLINSLLEKVIKSPKLIH